MNTTSSRLALVICGANLSELDSPLGGLEPVGANVHEVIFNRDTNSNEFAVCQASVISAVAYETTRRNRTTIQQESQIIAA
jgi:hypothetical protein